MRVMGEDIFKRARPKSAHFKYVNVAETVGICTSRHATLETEDSRRHEGMEN